MAKLTVLYWRDIPSQVVVKIGRKAAKQLLSDRFQEAIDLAAMRGKQSGTDDYLAEWRRGEPTDCGDDLDGEAIAAARQLEEDYTKDRLVALVANYGNEA